MKKIAVLLTIIIAFLGIFIFSCEEEKIEEVKNVTNKLTFKEIRVDSVSYSMSKVSWILENLNKNSIDDFGICYNTSGEPTLEDNTIKIPPYSSGNKSIEGLSPNTKYYFRLFAEIGDATVFSKEDNFSTNPLGTPTVTTAEVTYIDATSATSGGNITDNGGFEITACGVCWSTSQNPTVSDNHTNDGTGTGSFTSVLTGLNEETTYYVRAYATNEAGTAYGEKISFTIGITAWYFNNDPLITQSSYAVGANNNYLVYNSHYSRLDFKAKREPSSSGYGGHPYWFEFNSIQNISQSAYTFNLEISENNNPSSFATNCYFLIIDSVLDMQNGGMEDYYNIGIFISNDTRYANNLAIGLCKNDQNGFYIGSSENNVIDIQTLTEYNVRVELVSNSLQLALKDDSGATIGTISTPIVADDFNFRPSYLLYISGNGGLATSPNFIGILNSIILG